MKKVIAAALIGAFASVAMAQTAPAPKKDEKAPAAKTEAKKADAKAAPAKADAKK
jgi:hypothetical protein